MKKVSLFAVLIILSTTAAANAKAQFDFDTYIPTLDALYQAGQSPIKSGYSFVFSPTNQADAKFTYYTLNPDNTLTPVYYTYTLTYPVNGAVNYGNITSGTGGMPVTGYFFDNSNQSHASNYYVYGGAIYNDGQIGNTHADFIGNHLGAVYGSSTYDRVAGGTIANMAGAVITSITGDFIGNYTDKAYEVFGGVLYNAGSINQINSNFIGNYTKNDEYFSPLGSLIYNLETIGKITGDFIANDSLFGSQIYNKGTIDTITGNFIANVGHSFISNGGQINSISGNFIGNLATPISQQVEKGYIKSITGRFIGNSNSSYGGAIINSNYEDSRIDLIQADFIGNHVTDYGGAIFNNIASIGIIEGNFIGNYANGTYYIQGGAIYNTGSIEKINAQFTGNYVTSTLPRGPSQGGALYNNRGNLLSLSGSFIRNRAEAVGNAEGGALYNTMSNTFENNSIQSEFRNNLAQSQTGTASGGAIMNTPMPDVTLPFDYMTNQASEPTFQKNDFYRSNMRVKASVFNSNKVVSDSGNAYGGAIAAIIPAAIQVYNYDERVSDITLDEAMQSTLTITNSDFYNNTATSASGEARGGAVYSNNDVNIVADGAISTFSGNTANGVSNAVYIAEKPAEVTFTVQAMMEPIVVTKPLTERDSTLTLTTLNGGIINMNDGIDGDPGYKLMMNGSGTININGNISNAQIISGETVNILSQDDLRGLSPASLQESPGIINVASGELLNHNNSLTVNSGIINIGNLGLTQLKFNRLDFNGGALNIENTGVDLANRLMGSISATDYHAGSTVVNVDQVDILSDSADPTTSIAFADNVIADKVSNRVSEAMGPVYNYAVEYNPSTGEFEFTRPQKPTGDDINPEVKVPVIAAVAAVSVLNDEIYSRVLAGTDTPQGVEVSSYDRRISHGWIKTFGSDDSVDLKDFASADTKYYGLIGGFGSGRINEGHGISAVYNLYGAYAGGEQKFAREKVTQNAGYLGVSAHFYAGSFFTGITANIGTIRNQAENLYGKDKFNSYLTGAAAKAGYNFYRNGWTFQPNLYGSYTYVKVDDYTSKSGVKVKFGDMGVIEAAPGLKVAKSFDNGLSGYVEGRYVWSFSEGAHVLADGFVLPDTELKPYVEYGVGLEKAAQGDIYTGFIQISRRDGGRDGWNATAGLKINF